MSLEDTNRRENKSNKLYPSIWLYPLRIPHF